MEQKKIASLIREIENSLRPAIEDDTLREQYAWWILESIADQKKIALIMADTIAWTDAQKTKLATWIDKIVNEHMPIAYLIGNVPFNDLDILVEPPTLIPRPETEEWVIDLIAKLKTLKSHTLTILDMCSGSGCIALALAKAFPQSTVYALDLSDKAIALGKKNAAHNGIKNVTFMQSDLFNELNTQHLFDIIVSNPPYISFDEFQELDASVSTWEDKQALVAADNGTAIINDIIEDAADYLKTDSEIAHTKIPQLIIEIGYRQADIVQNLMNSAGWIAVKILKDLEGKDRVVTGRILHAVDAQKKS
jgi:release factor glutamine methyltransferase